MTTPSNSGANSFTQWWIAHPMVGFIGTAASVVGLLLAMYFYYASQATRDLVVATDPPVTIVRAGQSSSVDILYHGEKLSTDVYARQVYVWNAGSDSIRPENVLEPVGIVIPHATILETRVKRVTRPLTNISAKIASSGTDKVMLSWNILEHNDGASIDIVYTSPDVGRLDGVGTVEHQGAIRVREYQSARDPTAKGWQRTLNFILIGVLVPLVCVGGSLGIWRQTMQMRKTRPIRNFEVFMSGIFAIAFMFAGIFVLWYVLDASRELIPSGL